MPFVVGVVSLVRVVGVVTIATTRSIKTHAHTLTVSLTKEETVILYIIILLYIVGVLPYRPVLVVV